MSRVALVILLFISALFLPVWLVAPLAALYAWHFLAIELIVMAALIDAYFGVASSWPYYTFGALLLVLTSIYLQANFSLFSKQ